MATRVLVTNDDGIDGEGLRVLTAELDKAGYEIIVVAPDSDYSGAGTSIISKNAADFSGTGREVAFEKRSLAEAPNVEAYAVAAPPAMCSLLAMRGAFGDIPELVASGTNWGLNTGTAVRHSGTVSAAVTAASFGVHAIAVSAAHDWEDQDAPLRFDTAATVAVQLLGLMPGSAHSVLNINVPRLGVDELAGITSASVSKIARYRSYVESKEAGFLKMGFMMTDDDVEPDSDTAAVLKGLVAVSSLTPYGFMDCSDVVIQATEEAA